jgi:hypothetical protein
MLVQAQGLQEYEVPRISTKSAGEGGMDVSLIHRPPLPPRREPWYTFLLEAESNPEPYCGFTACAAGCQRIAPKSKVSNPTTGLVAFGVLVG